MKNIPADPPWDAYRGVSLIQPDLRADGGAVMEITPARSGNSARRERDRGTDISAQTFGMTRWIRSKL